MTRFRPAIVLVACVTAAAMSLPASATTTSGSAKKGSSVTHIGYRQWTSAADFGRGTHAGTATSNGALVIASPTGTFAYTDPYGDGSTTTYDVASWQSPEITPAFSYTELVGSWNAETPAGTWVQLSVTGLADDGTRSKSYILGRWAEGDDAIHRTSVPAQADALATVSIDTLVASTGRSLTSWRLTVSLFRETGTTTTPSVGLVGAMASQLPTGVKKLPASPLGGAEGTTLDVPTYSQETHVGEFPQYNGGGEAWCSPTSTAMVLAYWQHLSTAYGPSPADYADIPYDDPQADYAAASTYDYNYDGTGNWPFNTAYAGRYDLESFVTRLRSLTEAEQFIKAGIPLVVSVTFKKGELSGAGYGTNGHLMVIVGFTQSGDVVVNDPASHLIASNDQVRTVYDRTEFENVWVPHSGGITYVIHPTSVPLPPRPAEANW